MFIDDIDLADLYRKRLQLVERIEKKPEHWGKRTEKMAENYTSLADSYLLQLSGRIDLKGAESLFDMGCDLGTVSLTLAKKMSVVYGVDYSQGIPSVAIRHAAQMNTRHVQWVQRAWEEHWDDSSQYDIVVASHSTLVVDIHQAMTKLNNQIRLRAYTIHLVSLSLASPTAQHALGREMIELPSYIYALNVLYQMGIRARVDFIRGPNCQQDNSTQTHFLEDMCWSMGELSADEVERLETWYQQQDPRMIVPASRDWTFVRRDNVPREALQ